MGCRKINSVWIEFIYDYVKKIPFLLPLMQAGISSFQFPVDWQEVEFFPDR